MSARHDEITDTLEQLRNLTFTRQDQASSGIQAKLELRGTLTFTIPDRPDAASGKQDKEHTVNNATASANSTHYVCQTYGYRSVGKGQSARNVLERKTVTECPSASAAEQKAKRMQDQPGFVGVDAFAVTVDEELGDYSEPEFLIRLGDVPSLEV